jgi:Tol biopolymer transport system component
LYDIARQTTGRFTYDPADDSDAVWSPDGQRVIFASNRNGTRGLYQKPVDGSSEEENLVKSDLDRLVPRDWSSDGRFVIYFARSAKTGADVWYLSLSGERKPTPYLQTAFDETNAHISPDGQWIAYQSDESEKQEIYVRSFPGADRKTQISTSGGYSPCWRRDYGHCGEPGGGMWGSPTRAWLMPTYPAPRVTNIPEPLSCRRRVSPDAY